MKYLEVNNSETKKMHKVSIVNLVIINKVYLNRLVLFLSLTIAPGCAILSVLTFILKFKRGFTA